jgi:hypothetical protein
VGGGVLTLMRVAAGDDHSSQVLALHLFAQGLKAEGNGSHDFFFVIFLFFSL